MKQFTKKDLKYGNIIELEDGRRYIFTFSTNDNSLKVDQYFLRLDYVGQCSIDTIDYECVDDKFTYKDIKIIKIYENYTLKKILWKESKPILNDSEKEYLSNIIKPFKDRIIYIEKKDRRFSFIAITLLSIHEEIGEEYIYLPTFEKDTMYKNMVGDKKYTLEELGL